MREQLIIDILFMIGFIVMSLLQAIIINGVHESLQGAALKDDLSKKTTYQGNILYMIAPRFIEKYKYRYWSKPLYSCIKCMSSIHGALTYWPLVIYLFGFKWEEIPVYLADVFALVFLNYYFYKKV